MAENRKNTFELTDKYTNVTFLGPDSVSNGS